MPDMEKMSLKTFWDEMEQRLAACSADALRTIPRAMVREMSPAERRAFLDKLKPEEETVAAAEAVIEPEDLLSDIDDLVQELQADMEQAEAWKERHRWDDDYDEEDSLGPYAELVAPLTALFDRVEAVFDYGDLPLARISASLIMRQSVWVNSATALMVMSLVNWKSQCSNRCVQRA